MAKIIQGVDNVNRELKQLFGGVEGVNREFKERWEGVGGVNRQVFQKWNGELYVAGNEFINVTGGWYGYFGSPTLTKYAGRMNLDKTDSYSGSKVCPANDIDVTGYRKLKAKCNLARESDIGNITLALASDRNSGGSADYKYHKIDSKYVPKGFELNFEVDISAYTGLRIISIGVYAVGIDIYKIWLE